MAKRIIRSSLKKEELQKLVRQLPGIISGRSSSRFGLHRLFWGAIAYQLFTEISGAFEAKSFGLPDELGNEWEDLTQRYKAYNRPLAKGELPANLERRLKNKSTLGLLTPGEYKKWRSIFGVLYHSNKDVVGEEKAKEFAGQVAWTRLKEAGAKTKWNELGNRPLLINRLTDRLYLSLLPGNFNDNVGYYKKNRNQIFVISRGKLTIGTKVPYANMVSKSRPIWPEDISVWLDRAVTFARDCVYAKLQRIVK